MWRWSNLPRKHVLSNQQAQPVSLRLARPLRLLRETAQRAHLPTLGLRTLGQGSGIGSAAGLALESARRTTTVWKPLPLPPR